MNKTFRWFLISAGIILLVFTVTLIFRWDSLPWSPGYKAGPTYLSPPGETQPTATFFSPTPPTPTPDFDLVWIDPDLPAGLSSQFEESGRIRFTDSREVAETFLEAGDGSPLDYWIYALAAPFPTVRDGLPSAALMKLWEGGEKPQGFDLPLLLSPETSRILTSWWGPPGEGAVKLVEPENLIDQAWSLRTSLALVPFEQLSPEWKVLRVDGVSPLDDRFDPPEYFLSVPITAAGSNPAFFQDLQGNRDEGKFTSVVLTGVTALVRATAWTMEDKGINYPAQDIKDWLLEADILHISNEVPFLQGCPYPNPSQKGLRFCSDPRYIQLLESIGTDVVELTGDHFGDYGPDAMLYTLKLYQERDWPYYGGGATSQEAQEPVLFDHNGNKIAFLGCNAKGGGYATAAPAYPGAVACDFPKMTGQIKDLRERGYLPIATFQHFEYYVYPALPDQIRDARTLTNAGAVIVSGSQAHQPQAIEFNEGSFVHHGLGNLFFDQIYEIPPNTATAFIDRHLFYDGRHISTELLTIQFVDFARARPMDAGERETLLRTIFNASGW